ncbi:putative glucan endo-1,3-beta-glucosidase [Iris pallida]|uniref:glucan endo-1,3-beta-D-glucosidase n=1 Tax=Iris pallida TaxID=29817 RepID=A0AAX6GQM3_IRIPA|nr:putative glucan endo-1,3-beta-glucosidase [Iris pallida]
MASSLFLLLLLPLLLSAATTDVTASIGVNYGAYADNLPPPSQVASFLKSSTTIDRVKLFDSNPDFIRAFAGTGISLAITAPNGEIPNLSKPPGAAAWLASSVLPFLPATNISLILVGNEIMATADRNLIAHLVPAMRSLKSALSSAGYPHVRVSTPHSLGILSSSDAPSSGRFRRGYDRAIFAPMLRFHRDTNTPFVVNPYPYFSYNDRTLSYALFRPNAGVWDPVTRINYTNMFDAQMDAVHAAMDRLGFGDVEILIGETGWPSAGDPGQLAVDPATAAEFNGKLIRKVTSGGGTPRMPGRRFETYLFALFNENLKPGPTAERNWGLFRPDLSPVYDVGVLRAGQTGRPTPAPSGTKWCVPKPGASESALQANIEYVCSTNMVDCKQIQNGGSCFLPNTVQNHAAYAMNAYYQAAGRNDFNCDFRQTATLSASDPSYGTCKFTS